MDLRMGRGARTGYSKEESEWIGRKKGKTPEKKSKR